MNNTAENNSKNIVYSNMYSGLASEIYKKVSNTSTKKELEHDYVMVLFSFNRLVNQLIKEEIPKNYFTDAIKASAIMRAYLFAMPHMEYPEEVRAEFFKSCYWLSCYLDKNMENKKITVEPEVMFLLRTASVRTSALLSIWEEDELSHGKCTCCGKDLPTIKFADCKGKQHTPKLVEEWDLLAVAKNMALESKENFSLYKKVAKVYGAYTCGECGAEQTLLDAYIKWCYTNTQLKQPDEKLMEWLYEKCEEMDKGYETREQVRCYRKFMIDYLQGQQKQNKAYTLKYFEAMQDSYKYEREIHGKQLEYYTQKCKEMVEELLEDSSLSKEEKEACELVHMDLQYDELGSQVLSKKEREEKYEEMIAFYDQHLGVGNKKSHECRIQIALPLAENRSNQEEQERGFNMLFQQLDILETHNPNAREEISRIYELISYIYREYLKNYQYSMIYYQPYLRYIEETYGKNSEYAADERRIFNEIREMYNKQKRKQEQQQRTENKKPKLKRKKFSYDWEDCESGVKNSHTMIEEILTSKRLPHVEELVIGSWGECYDDSAQAIVDGIVEHKEQFQHIKSLYIGDMEMEECEVSWILQADYSKLWEALPNLEKLTIKGSNGLALGTISHSNLKELEIICGGLPKGVIQSIAHADLPELTSLNLYIGVKSYGFNGDLQDMKDLLAHPFPKLTKLGLVDSEIQDEIAQEVVKSAYMSQLTELSLGKGSLSDKGGAVLLEEVPKHPNITLLDLEYHYMSCKMMLQLLELPIAVNVDEQQEEDVYEEEIYRYPMLTE